MPDAMISLHVTTEDKIGALISNSADAIVTCTAALSLGALWSSGSHELDPKCIIDRFSQIHPKLIFADDGDVYAAKTIGLTARIQQRWAGIVSLCPRIFIVISHCTNDVNWGGLLFRRKEGRSLSQNSLFHNPLSYYLHATLVTKQDRRNVSCIH